MGLFSYDAGSPLTSGTWVAAREGAACAWSAAQHVAQGARSAFALTRPPGHHAGMDFFGGYCFLNNAAIAAQALRDAGCTRVAVLDIDYHHGNGTQAIFYDRADVFVCSVHGDPQTEYPYYLGYADERGAGAGEGFNLNLPLPLGSPDGPWLDAGDKALARIREFAPTALVVALGLDASESDPLQGLKVTGAGFHAMAGKIAGLGLPTVLIQEGGYLSDDLGRNLVQFLSGFESGRRAA
jgi:acetoin utilization deacetylase AcuC-like enzyme